MSFDVIIKNPIRLQLGWLNEDEQQKLGEFTIAEMKARITGGIDNNDQPARPLTRRYQQAKARRGGVALRNLTLSGGTLRNLAVLDRGSSLKIGFQDPRASNVFASKRNAALFGLSPSNQAAVVEEHDRLLARSVEEMFVAR